MYYRIRLAHSAHWTLHIEPPCSLHIYNGLSCVICLLQSRRSLLTRSKLQPTMASVFQQAKVKSVLSGDTLLLSAVQNPSNERILCLAYVAAPRMRRGDDEVRSNLEGPACSLRLILHP